MLTLTRTLTLTLTLTLARTLTLTCRQRGASLKHALQQMPPLKGRQLEEITARSRADHAEVATQLDESTRAAVDNLDGAEPGPHADLADRYADVRERLRERAAYSSSAALSTVFG